MMYVCLRPMRSERAPAMGTQKEPRMVPVIDADSSRLREAPRKVVPYVNTKTLKM